VPGTFSNFACTFASRSVNVNGVRPELATMSNRHWNFPVMVICKRTGKIYTVGTTKEALDMLLNAWPVAEGRAFMMAMQICADVESGIRQPLEARNSFVAAAKEAGVPIETTMVE
jgi:hypothetical protein